MWINDEKLTLFKKVLRDIRFLSFFAVSDLILDPDLDPAPAVDLVPGNDLDEVDLEADLVDQDPDLVLEGKYSIVWILVR